MHRQVALALLKLEAIDAGPEATEQETKVLGAIGGHENVVRLYDLDSDGLVPYMVFEYLPGGTFSSYLSRAREAGGQVPVDTLIRLSRQICRGLSHLHQKRIIHRDLLPGNVWLDERGGAHLGDFDTAFLLDDIPDNPHTDETYGA
jgi:eukaryotic-like serine/threonine-protein kinase